MKMRERHKEDLGLDVPLGYFSKSKADILEATVNKKSKVVSLNKKLYYWSAAAAVVALVFTLSVFSPFKEEVNNDIYNDVLIATLSVNENEIDGVVDEFIDDNLLTENIFLE